MATVTDLNDKILRGTGDDLPSERKETLDERVARLDGEAAGAKARADEAEAKVKSMGESLLKASAEIQQLRQQLQEQGMRAFKAETAIDFFASALKLAGGVEYQLKQDNSSLRAALQGQGHA